jgi:acyl phosphate:glycerol-3-phosphate acyltransferase
MTDFFLVVAAYFVGSISAAILTCRLMGLPDPRTQGSHNPGATNVLRIGGKKAAAITLAGDMLKGTLPLLGAHLLHATPPILALTGLAAFIGHLYPVFFRFQGGKGVATALGVLLGWSVWLWLVAAGIWLFVAKVLKISSVAALCAFAIAPAITWLLSNSIELTLANVVITALMFWRHRSNIQNLLSGTEGKIGERSDRP